MKTKPTATSTSAIAIFVGVLGSRPRRASAVHSDAKSGAARTSTAGLTDWNQGAGTSKPATTRSVRLSAKKFIDDAVCSKPIQNRIVNAKTTSSTIRRSRSSRVRAALTGASFAAMTRLGTSPIPARYLRRSARYVARPSSMPTPAAPNPQCQPQRLFMAK